jgi:hydrogenase maturation protein HypF
VADLHPDYPTTQWARAQGLPLLLVQHHHAHVASCLAEHGIEDTVAAVAFDGSGLGTDGTLWGGEFFVGTIGALERVGHLNPVPLAGGDRAARECWRMALAWLRAAGLSTDRLTEQLGPKVQTVEKMISQGVNAPPTTSVGRLFDAAAYLLGVGDAQTFEGQAAMRLEALAWSAPPSGHVELEGDDARPLIRDLTDGSWPVAVRARRFHSSLAHWVASRCAGFGCETVVLTGGVFQNALLTREVETLLCERGMKPLTHRAVPTNDGGLALGQLAIAANHSGLRPLTQWVNESKTRHPSELF